jgi:hypothetical protein
VNAYWLQRLGLYCSCRIGAPDEQFTLRVYRRHSGLAIPLDVGRSSCNADLFDGCVSVYATKAHPLSANGVLCTGFEQRLVGNECVIERVGSIWREAARKLNLHWSHFESNL